MTREDQRDFKKVNITLFDFKRRRSGEEVVSEGFLEEDSFRSWGGEEKGERKCVQFRGRQGGEMGLQAVGGQGSSYSSCSFFTWCCAPAHSRRLARRNEHMRRVKGE